MRLEEDIPDPLAHLQSQQARARREGHRGVDFAALATVDERGHPHVRTMTLRALEAGHLWFAANASAPKAQQIAQHAQVEAMLHLEQLGLQYRLSGPAKLVPARERPELYARAPAGQQAWDWVHEKWAQSSFVAHRHELEEVYTSALEGRKPTEKDPRGPAPTAGYIRVACERVEIYLLDPQHRLHDRRLFTRHGTSWYPSNLVP